MRLPLLRQHVEARVFADGVQILVGADELLDAVVQLDGPLQMLDRLVGLSGPCLEAGGVEDATASFGRFSTTTSCLAAAVS